MKYKSCPGTIAETALLRNVAIRQTDYDLTQPKESALQSFSYIQLLMAPAAISEINCLLINRNKIIKGTTAKSVPATTIE